MTLGYTIGRWPRMFKKWPYDSLPIGASLVFEDVRNGYSCAMAAHKYARSHGMKFESKKSKDGYVVKRVSK